MGALVAILQSDPNLLRCQVARLKNQVSLSEGGKLPDAYGYGFYSASDVLLGKRPNGAPTLLSLADLVGPVDSEALLIYARTATIGNHKDENTHPFRFRRWLFAHAGTVEDWPQVKPKLLGSLPDFLRRNIEGDTDSEHVFMHFLKLLRDEGRIDSLDLVAATAGHALAHTVKQIDAWCREVGSQKPSALNCVATNGRILVATRRGRPLHYALIEGIMPCVREGIAITAPESDPRVRPHRMVKAVCFASILQHSDGFMEVPDGSVATVSRELQVTITPLSSQ